MKNKNIYSISVDDIKMVCEESFHRKPTDKEIQFIEDKIGDYIPWYDIIESLLNDFNLNSQNEKKAHEKNNID